MITLEQYFGGRRETHPTECSPSIEDNAGRAVPIFNALIEAGEADGVEFPIQPSGDFEGSQLASGWRPPSINGATKGASATSRHMTGEAADMYDPEGAIDAWLMSERGQQALALIGLWMEHPDSTPGWAHVQTVPPRSGNRVFRP